MAEAGCTSELEQNAGSGARFRYGWAKLYLDFEREMSLAWPMILGDDEIDGLPRRLFALAGRNLERAMAAAGVGEAGDISAMRSRELAGELHGCGQDLLVIADTITALTQENDA